MSAENSDILSLGSFDFTPDWAKKDAGVSVGRVSSERSNSGAGRLGGKARSEGLSRGPGAGGGRGFKDKKPFGEKKPFDRRPRFEERPRPLDAEVKILPETKALGTIIRKLQNDVHAYKLKDLAYFFLDNPQSVLLKISPRNPATSQPCNPVTFYQCKACGFVSTKEEDVLQHALASHLSDYYDAREIDCEPPKGNFNCVARCGLSGVLLGPPNLHEFSSIVREMVSMRYPEMSEDQYRARLEMVRDAEVIEEWRKGVVKKTVFFAKGTADQEGSAALSREQAEGEFRRTILPSLVDRPKTLMITADMAERSPVKPLVWAVRDALAAERRAPYNMCFALRGAFHHRKFRFFRTNDARGQEFVTNVEYKEFDTEHAIPELAAAAKFVTDHPCCDKTEFPQDPDFEKHLAWLVTTGHVVAFTNGVYSAVEKFPKYGPQWKKRSAPVTEAEKPESVEAPAEVEKIEKEEEKKDEVAPVVAE